MSESVLLGRRLVLFGAGRVGQAFQRHFTALQVLAFCDNDPVKQGTATRSGVPIVGPAQLATLDFDLVVISTGWVESISEQLLALGVPREKIFVPPKSMLAINHGAQPFRHPPTKALAAEFMHWAAELQCSGARFCLDFGTLLGACREQDFIAWDDDIDLVAVEADFPLLVDTIRRMRSSLPSPPGVVVDCQLHRRSDETLGVSIFFGNEPGHEVIVPFEAGFMRRDLRNGRWLTQGSGPQFIAPERHFAAFERLEFLGHRFNVPQDYLAYLDFVYGDWRQPKREVTLADYPTEDGAPLSVTRCGF
ncbi:LicD family protein [Pseudomonas oryzihabitans]|uniref:LicD family protein n=1 Tax=Pseudomonas oryzihabitans TaxID=47885 RepID=UPI0011A5DD9E|nr:LicD family protein [Pseudomonas oryzihabitans]